MANTAVADPDSGLSQAQLAQRYGLRVAGERPPLAEYTRKLWAYRHFMTAYSRAKVASSFSQTQLGQLWQVLTPVTNAAVYFLIFGLILNQHRNVSNFIAYLCTGVFIFMFTQTAVTNGTSAITSNLGLIRALQFPRAALPITVTLVQLQQLLMSMVVLAGIVLLTGEPITFRWVLIVPTLLLQTVFNIGLTMIMARIGAKVTDLKQVMPFVMRTWLYASGVLYPVALFRQHLPPWAATILEGNPALVYIELARHALLESNRQNLVSPPTQLWLLGIAWAVLVGVGGFIYFWRGEEEYGRG
ncbi:ABC transporter [Micromonospora globispora]|uniref:Transport permease protein n=1 Tax=Micromonospora globispora TaxID=1450148 RepID=A0A317JVD9_9ACTN|nr:ABC transporter permease [Micromonospora globispora]PWU44318.1 ABC transporter [Micromonospora globispora]PWU60897.1 ABC transporter [Micromonospora globispora]RQX02708.1 ABC transporter [Micromonospora globispora]